MYHDEWQKMIKTGELCVGIFLSIFPIFSQQTCKFKCLIILVKQTSIPFAEREQGTYLIFCQCTKSLHQDSHISCEKSGKIDTCSMSIHVSQFTFSDVDQITEYVIKSIFTSDLKCSNSCTLNLMVDEELLIKTSVKLYLKTIFSVKFAVSLFNSFGSQSFSY